MTQSEFKIQGTRIGLLGGTFDPVHFGHLAAANAVYEAMGLDLVIFIPAFQPPHKYHFSLAPFTDRSAMLELALKSWPDFHISYMEAERNGPSFTCDTLAEFRQKAGDDKQLFFIIGFDAFREIHTWKKYKRLGLFANLVVITRPPHDEKSVNHYIAEYFSTHRYDKKNNVWVSNTARGEIRVVPMTPVDISSTEIRRRIDRGEALDALISEDVAAYIKNSGLYS